MAINQYLSPCCMNNLVRTTLNTVLTMCSHRKLINIALLPCNIQISINMLTLAYRFHYWQHRNMTTNLSSKLLSLFLHYVSCCIKQNDSTQLINILPYRKKRNCIQLTQGEKKKLSQLFNLMIKQCYMTAISYIKIQKKINAKQQYWNYRSVFQSKWPNRFYLTHTIQFCFMDRFFSSLI